METIFKFNMATAEFERMNLDSSLTRDQYVKSINNNQNQAFSDICVLLLIREEYENLRQIFMRINDREISADTVVRLVTIQNQ